MGIDAGSLGLSWDMTAGETVAASQRWVLAAMRKHGPTLVSLLWRILGNEQDVCDAYQDTFVQLAHRRDGRVPDDIRAFVIRSAVNTAISMLRTRHMRARAAERMAQAPPRAAAVEDGRELDERQLRDSLRKNIARLPEKLRDVLLLKDLAELPYSQVAAMLGMSVATARVYRCRAIRLLGGWMARREED